MREHVRGYVFIAEEVQRDPKLTLVDTQHPSMFWIEFAEQWDPKSVWADKRVRLAVKLN